MVSRELGRHTENSTVLIRILSVFGTRPEAIKIAGKNRRVPKVLLSGNHKLIAEWRKAHSFRVIPASEPESRTHGSRIKSGMTKKKK